MRSLVLAAAVVVPLGVGVGAALAARPAPAAAPVAPAATTWSVDPVHSSVVFAIKHLDTAWYHGTFGKTEGQVIYDAENGAGASVALTIHADSVSTHVEQRDTHIKSPDFLNAKQFPTITFKSTAVAPGSDGRLSVTGDLTFLGVTKSLTVPIEVTGTSSDPKMGTRTGFLAQFAIKRGDFGSRYAAGMLSDEVRLTVSLETVKQ